MPWFRVNDGLRQSRKVMAIPRDRRTRVIGLWTLAGSWSSAELTDGHVPAFMVEELAGAMEDAETLAQVGLWDRVADGYVFHDWQEYNPTRKQVESDRAAAASRMRSLRRGRSGDVRANTTRTAAEVPPHDGRTAGEVHDTRPDPYPTTPQPPATSVAMAVEPLRVVVVENLPETLLAAADPGVISGALSALTATAWTPEALAEACRARGWDGAGAGALVTWLRGLAELGPPTPRQRRAALGCDACSGGWVEETDGTPRRCPTCNPRATGGAS